MATKRPRAEEEKVWDAFQNCWTINGEPVDGDNESDGEEFVSLKERRALREERLRKQRKRPVAEEEEVADPEPAPEPQQRALVDEAEDLRRQQQGMDKEKTKRAEEEARMLREAARVGTNALKSAREIADDTRFGRNHYRRTGGPLINRWTTNKLRPCGRSGASCVTGIKCRLQ